MTSKRGDRSGPGATGEAALAWPDDPETVTVTDIDFEALAHVLANCCRRGGRMRHYHSLAAHAVIVSEEIEALGGLSEEDRCTLALHALVSGAASAWFRGEWTVSARAAEPGSRTGPGRTARLAAGIEAAVREAAGLSAALDEEQAEVLRFVGRMAAAAESRDLLGDEASANSGIAFPPLKRRIRSIAPERAAQAWLARFRALAGDRPPVGGPGGKTSGKAGEAGTPDAAGA